MERLSALDAEFLQLEDGIVHMHIGGACVFDDPPPPFHQLEALVASKLHQIPRYRQRVRPVPLALGRPVWVDDPHFDLGYHLRHTALPAPGDDGAFHHLMGRVMSQALDRERPLWEAWLVEGLQGSRWALVVKVHHCMVDGIAGVELLTTLLDLGADATVAVAQPWAPRPEEPGVLKVLDAWGGLASDALGMARAVPGSIVHPLTTGRSLVTTVEGAVRFVRHLTPTHPLSIEGPIGPHRVWSSASTSLADVKAICSAYDCTVNDVVLAAVSGGYRALLLAHGDDVDRAALRSLVPVSTRHDDGHGIPDNRVSALLYELPVGNADPVDRLEIVHRRMSALKSSHIAEAGEAVTSIGNLAPPMLLATFTRLALRSVRRFGQRSLNTVTTNVPGPQFPLYCLGRRMLEYLPFVPISHGLRVGTAILSYNGRVFFGVTGDYSTVPDVEVVATAAVSDIERLHHLARSRRADPGGDGSPDGAGPDGP